MPHSTTLRAIAPSTPPSASSQKGFASAFIFIIVVIFLIVSTAGFFGFRAFRQNTSQEAFKPFNLSTESSSLKISGRNNPFSGRYSAGKCQGEGTTTFTHPPMKIEDIGRIEPYGLMVDAHVIPTSHGYISPVDFHSERDKYPVFAIADGFIVNISHRGQFIGDNQKDRPTDEYQMYFEHSCTFYTYYDLLTSLAPEIEREVGKLTGFEHKQVRIPVKAGQLVGRIGGQTVDFAVWNFEKEPAYFVNPKSYAGDEDRFYLDGMFKYFAEPLRSQLLAKNIRTSQPRTGKVDYDEEGKLVGNWFREGSGGFNGLPGKERKPEYRYWDGHLAIVYDYVYPTQIKFSIGNFEGKAAQFTVKGNSPDPAAVGIDSGQIKYELQSTVSQRSPGGSLAGTVLLQLIEPTKLKLEIFPEKTADQVSGFTAKASIYER